MRVTFCNSRQPGSLPAGLPENTSAHVLAEESVKYVRRTPTTDWWEGRRSADQQQAKRHPWWEPTINV